MNTGESGRVILTTRKGMIIKRYVAVLFLTLSVVLFIPFRASAEGWVLWEKGEVIYKEGTQSISWELIDAYPSYEQCTNGKPAIWKIFKKQAEEDKQKMRAAEVKSVEPELVTKSYKEGSNILSWTHKIYCLPGTLDPRERR